MTNLGNNPERAESLQPVRNDGKAPWHAPRLTTLDLGATAGGPVSGVTEADEPGVGAS